MALAWFALALAWLLTVIAVLALTMFTLAMFTLAMFALALFGMFTLAVLALLGMVALAVLALLGMLALALLRMLALTGVGRRSPQLRRGFESFMDGLVRHFGLTGNLLSVFANFALGIGKAVFRVSNSLSRRLLGRRRLLASLPLA